MTSDLSRLEEERWDRVYSNINPRELYQNPEFMLHDNQIEGALGAFGAGFLYEGGIPGQAGLWTHDKIVYPEEPKDPNFNPFEHMKALGLSGADQFTMLEESDRPEDIMAYEMLLNAQSPADVDKVLRHLGRKRALNESAEEHGFATFMGSLAGFLPDVAITMFLGSPAAAGAAGAARIARMAELADKITRAGKITRGSVNAARAPAALRTGTVGAFAGLAETGTYELNRIVTNDEYLFNAVGGFLLGGALGGLFPRVVGRVHVDADNELVHGPTPRTEEDLTAARNDSEYGMEGMGAATSPEGRMAHADEDGRRAIEENERIRQAASPFTPITDALQRMKGVVGKGKAFQSMKTFTVQVGNAVNIHAKVNPAFAKFMDDAYQILGRSLQGNVKHVHELKGQRSVRNMADEAEFYEQMGRQWVEQNDRIYQDKFVKKVGDKFGLHEKLGRESEIVNRARKRFNADQIPTRAELLSIAQYLRRIRALEAENAEIVDRLTERAAKDENFTYDPSEYVHRVPTFEETLKLFPRIRDISEDEILTALRETAEDMANHYDQRYDELLDENVKAGMLNPEDKILHYSPQLYNQRAARQDSIDFWDWILEAIEKEPDIDWVNSQFSLVRRETQKNPDGTETELLIREDGDVLQPGESISSLIAKDPDLYREVRDMWSQKLKQERLKKYEDNKAAIDAKIADSQFDDAAAMEAHFSKQIDAADTAIGKLTSKLKAAEEAYRLDPKTNSNYPEVKVELEEQMAKASLRKAEAELKRDELQAVFNADDRGQMLKKQMRHRTKNRQKSKRLAQQYYKVDRKQAKAEMDKTVAEIGLDIRNSIMSGAQSHTSSLKQMDRLRTGNSRYMQRQINWRELAFTPNGKKFLNHEVESVDQIYLNTAMRQVAMNNTLGKYMEHVLGKTYKPGDDVLSDITGYLADQGQVALANAKSPREEALIRKMMDNLPEFFENMMRIYNRSHIKDGKDSAFFEILRGGTAITQLGTLAISQFTDPVAATAALPSGFGGKWWGNALNPFKSQIRTAGRLVDQVKEMPRDERLIFWTQGANASGMARYDAMVNPENIGQHLTGHYGEENQGILGFIRLATRDVGHLQNWATLAPLMNKGTQTNAGMLQLKAMHKYITDYDSFRQSDRENFARLGLGKRQVDQMKELFNNPRMVQKLDDGTDEGLIVPRMDRWPDFLASQYERALQKAQNEALVAPAFGDMPSALGAYQPLSIFYQFSSFSYKIANSLLRKLVQNNRLHKNELSSYTPWAAGIGLGATVAFLKGALNGQSPEEFWNRPPPQVAWDVISRSPFMVGQMTAIAESSFLLGGGMVNDVFGFPVLPEAPTYFKRQQGVYGLAGPVFGMGKQLWDVAAAGTDGDIDMMTDRMMRMTPVMNTVLLRTLMQLTSED